MKYKLICHFKLAKDMVEGGIREFVNDAERPAFLERELMGLVMLMGHFLQRVQLQERDPFAVVRG